MHTSGLFLTYLLIIGVTSVNITFLSIWWVFCRLYVFNKFLSFYSVLSIASLELDFDLVVSLQVLDDSEFEGLSSNNLLYSW